VENEMKKQIPFKIIGERFKDMLINGMELCAKALLIYLFHHYVLEEKSKIVGIEVSITCDSAKSDDFCCHMTAGWKINDKDAWGPLIIDQDYVMKICRLIFDIMQSERN
jgi:hypothetical protein